MTVLIKNALVFDGSGRPPFKSDIFINHERVNRLGDFPRQSADKVLDARGAMVIPGFIDINSGIDHYLTLFSDPVQENLLKRGITTVIGGNSGSSLAPLLDGSLISIRKWAGFFPVNVNWQSVAEFLKVLERGKLGTNFGTLIGHSTVRRAIVGEDLRDLTENEMKVFKSILEQGLKEGTFGLSSGLTYVHSHNVSHYELETLAKICAKSGTVYATQLRNYTDGLAKAINETLNLARNAGISVEINNFQPLKGFEKVYLEAVSLIEKEKMRTDINFDVRPADASLAEIYTLLPEWARNGSLEIMLGNVRNANTRERILDYLEKLDFENLSIAKVPPALDFLNGKSLKQFGENQNLPPAEALLKLMELSGLKAELWHKNVDMAALRQIMLSESAIIASDGGLDFINMVQKENLMPLEKAVFKATFLPAKKFRIKERGLISEGYFADLVVIKDGKPSEVLVNGSVVMEDKEIKKNPSGKILTRT